MNYSTRPPRKLSGLIDLAIADARRLDHGAYTPLHSEWHTAAAPGESRHCHVCLAGAVIAGTLGLAPDKTVNGFDEEDVTDNEWGKALTAINAARLGCWKVATGSLEGGATPEQEAGMAEIPVPAHSRFEDWETFEMHLASLADRARQLRALGL